MHTVSRKVLFGALVGALVSTTTLAATPQYHVSVLPTFGGTRNQGNSINDANVVAGVSNSAGSQLRHATAWYGDRIVDLGTLGGYNSSVAWPVKNNHDRIVGISQTASSEPNGEVWSCAGFFSPATNPTAIGSTCLGFVYSDGAMHALPTLGGNNGYASGANNRGEVVGWAETPLHDLTCEGELGPSHQVLQFLPVVWRPGEGRGAARALPLLPGDSSGSAVAINDAGQVVGISGACDQAVGRYTAAHVVLWENGTATDIGKGALTAPFWNTAVAINQHGDVVGFAGDPSDSTGNITHAFIWTRAGGLQFLNNAPDDNSTATGINDAGQVSGYFADASGALRGFIWDGTFHDLNDLRAPGDTTFIALATDINNNGVIAGRSGTIAGVRYAITLTPVSP